MRHVHLYLTDQKLTASDVSSALVEIADPYLLGIYLDIEQHKLEIFVRDCPQNTEKQKMRVIKYWLHRNKTECSWEVLANAVENMRGYGVVVERLRAKHIASQKPC